MVGEGSAQGLGGGPTFPFIRRADSGMDGRGGQGEFWVTSAEVKAEAERLITYWQRQLRLEDWDVTVIVPDYDPEGAAKISTSNVMGVAKITIRNPAITPPGRFGPEDLEISVVHELLHLRFPHIDPAVSSLADQSYELGIEQTARALVRLNRGERR